MKRGGAKIQRFFRAVFKSLVYLIFGLIVLILLLGILSRSSLVQTYLFQKYITSFSKKHNTDISVDRVYLSGLRTINLENITIMDHHKDTMIFVNELHTDISLKNIISNNTLYLTNIILLNPYFYLHKSKEDSTYNINYFVSKFSSAENDTSNLKPMKVVLETVNLINGVFILEADTVRDFGNSFNQDLIHLNKINSHLELLTINADSIDSKIDSLLFEEKFSSNLASIQHCDLEFNSSNLRLLGMELNYNQSTILDSLEFQFNDWSDWSNFEENVEMKLGLKNSLIYSGDIAYFVPLPKHKYFKTGLSGNISGTLSNISLEELEILYGKNSMLNGTLRAEGLPSIENTIIALDIKRSYLETADFQNLFDTTVQKVLKNLKFIDFYGEFDGFYYDFVADGTFNTGLGNIKSDINFKLPDQGLATYSGKLSTRNFKAGKLIGREDLIQNININTSLKGKGLKLSDADVQLKAVVSKSTILEYTYNKIELDANLKENLFDGLLSIDDSSLSLTIQGLINLDPNTEKIDITGLIQKADLDIINLTEKDGFVKGSFDLDFTGLTFDKSSGNGLFKDLEIFYDDKYLFLDSLRLVSTLVDSSRNIDIISELFALNFKGNFKLKNVYSDLERLWLEYKLQLINDESDIDAYYAAKSKNKTSIKSYYMEWSMFFEDLNPVISLVVPELFISHNTSIKGRFSVGNTEIFNVYTTIDTLIYDNYRLYSNEFDLSSSKFADSSNILAFIFLESEKQVIPDLIEGEKLKIETIWNDRQINFDTRFQQLNDSNFANVAGTAKFKKDSTILVFKKSDLKIFENSWDITETNRIIIRDEDIRVKNLKLSSTFESILIEGKVSRNPKDLLSVNFVDFNLRNINPLINRNISGVLNANLSLSNLYEQVQTFGKIRANDCTIEGFLIGDISGTSEWDYALNAIVSNYEIDRLGSKILDLSGHIIPKGDTTEFNFGAKLNKTNLEIIEPFATGVISQLTGTSSGFLTLTGNNFQPVLRGQIKVDDGGFNVDYLNTYYTFSEVLYFNTDNISSRNLVLKDRRGNTATINGGIFHDGFSNPVIDINAKMDNFEILNTSIKDNDLYYGNAVTSGNISFLGSFNDIQINADLESKRGTYIYIPTDSYTELEKEAHITFLSEIKKDSTLVNTSDVDLSGLSMNLNLNITPEAKMEIILDRQTGDIIKGGGRGELSLEIDTRGEFKMFGFMEIEKGSYNFTLLNVVNKEFSVKPGGRISWSGDPYKGELDLIGSYSLNVPLKPLMLSADSIFINSPQASKRSPVSVNLHLTGPLLNPDFNFDIDIPNPPVYQGYDFNNDLLAFQNRIQNNEDALNREVFSLIVLKQFSQDQGARQQPAGSNLSELFTNQLSNYLSSVDENLEVNLDLSGLSQEDLIDLQVRLSYSFLEGRLRLTREGGFTNSTNETDVGSIIGDWTVEYALTEDGQLKAKIFNRNNSNVYQPEAQSTNTTGMSILYTRSFDEFIELVKNQEKEKKRNEKKDLSEIRKSPAIKEELEGPTIENQ